MIPYLSGFENCWAWLLIWWLSHHLHVYSKLLPQFDHTIFSMWLLALRFQDFTNNLIPLVLMELWSNDTTQDSIRQVLLDFIDLVNQELIFNHLNNLRHFSDKQASIIV